MNVMMPKCDIDKIRSYIQYRPIINMLEIGSGGSTLYFSKFAKNYYSIEHNRAWFELVKKEAQRNKRTNIKLALKEVNDYVPSNGQEKSPNWAGLTSSDRFKEFKNYICLASSFDVVFDAVLIDGRARPECVRFLHDNNLVAESGIIFMHDYRPIQHPWSRKYYNVVEEKYTVVDYEGRGSGLAVLKLDKRRRK